MPVDSQSEAVMPTFEICSGGRGALATKRTNTSIFALDEVVLPLYGIQGNQHAETLASADTFAPNGLKVTTKSNPCELRA